MRRLFFILFRDCFGQLSRVCYAVFNSCSRWYEALFPQSRTKEVSMSSRATQRNVQKVPKQVVRRLLLRQISLDVNQPRKKFRDEGIEELLASIKNEGLQQLITVNPAGQKNGQPHFIIRFGERRFRALQRGGFSEADCIILPEPYDGMYDTNRDLAQASENACREPHTHAEIVMLVRRIVSTEIAAHSNAHGAVGKALERVAAAFGKSRSWADNYHRLGNLSPELLELLDEEDDQKRLNFQDACKLVVAPIEKQTEILKKAEAIRTKSGHVAMRRYIAQEARRIREELGEKVRGRKPSDEKRALQRLAGGLDRVVNSFCGQRHSSEYREYVRQLINCLSVIDVDVLLAQIKPALIAAGEIRTLLESIRATKYQNMR